MDTDNGSVKAWGGVKVGGGWGWGGTEIGTSIILSTILKKYLKILKTIAMFGEGLPKEETNPQNQISGKLRNVTS